jgi:hypothetical protein
MAQQLFSAAPDLHQSFLEVAEAVWQEVSFVARLGD